ncbi:hypothetical protein EXIGLDRAFT_255835 [Exidia glandulosa HHB12029]|uniref:F-box domain-containing protein n=1 Tax=Exidia glandulosa HHB12029 TaxID=1314781 RepID=A0A165DVS3_EXIGL|nr:hypothetical protein EXIGLDRAFT_255835 [Exidia glandulosa HHB12029]
MLLPDDIFLEIARAATDIGALDTGPGCTQPSRRAAMLFQLRDSYATKRALCLVSRAAHAICLPLMYEVVNINDPTRIISTIDALRHQGYGRWCRRLDVDVVSDDSGWPRGATNLWGILDACPYLDVLNITVLAVTRYPVTLPGRYNLPLSLLVQIAETYGHRLRRLELGGDTSVHYRGVEYLCARCAGLEVLV